MVNSYGAVDLSSQNVLRPRAKMKQEAVERAMRVYLVIVPYLALIAIAGGGAQMKLASSAFANGGLIPSVYAYCGSDAGNVSPPLEWKGLPHGAASLVLIMHDPDAPVGDFAHWVAYDIPANIAGLPQGASGSGLFLEGRNSYGELGYGGPCPPPGPPHHYVFELYALSVPTLGLPAGATATAVVRAAAPYVLAKAKLVGLYSR